MEKATWEDATTYSRDEPYETRTPRILATVIASMRISIIADHQSHKGHWIMNCYEVGIKEKVLCEKGEVSVEAVQQQAINTVYKKLSSLKKAIEPYVG